MGEITIIGTGWTKGQLTLQAVEALQDAPRIILHTERCGCAEWLQERGIAFESLDSLYESCEDFDEHVRAAREAVMLASETSDVVYCVSDIRDRSVTALVEKVGERARVIAGPPAEGALLACVNGETRCVEASDWQTFHLTPRENCLIRELDNRQLAAEVKLRLMEVYPEESRIWVLNADASVVSMPLYALDRGDAYDHRTCALIPAQRQVTGLERFDFEHLNEIMAILCGPGGCPWDRAQTHASLRSYMLEEAYEVIDAIDEGDMDHLYDELGDVLFQVAFHAEIARRHGEFNIADVTSAICEKMIHRHTHVFGDDQVADAGQVSDLWAKNKMSERGQTTHTEVLKSVTRALPSLSRAVKVLKRSAEVGMCDTDTTSLSERCVRRLRELEGGGNCEQAFGALLLDLAGLSRLIGVDPEVALNGAINRFIGKFEAVEQKRLENGEDKENAAPETLRKYWDLVKL